ncbi:MULTISPECIES: DNA/RNA nuclease SfsA [Caldisericum]|uniref:Sugar fermentation stimulation protein homolog n=1 Tax=Caldisericum exile TaxID=693075 RepID=A0A2J6WFN2_9BACT|nr:MAG: DNA/RNA nuclease SfsA [Caldisericum exile]
MKKQLFEIITDFEGTFIERLNKFLGVVEVNGKSVLAHIHDPGRLEGLLERGNKVLLKKFSSLKRKTEFEVIAVKFEEEIVLVNSRYHNDIAESLIRKGIVKFGESKNLTIKREIKFLNSRFDFLLKNDKKYLIEVKGCVLVKDGVALFPDAPTKRGARHLIELVESLNYGFNPLIFILIMRNATEFKPNESIDKDFSKNYFYAISKGVEVKKILLSFDGEKVYFEKFI